MAKIMRQGSYLRKLGAVMTKGSSDHLNMVLIPALPGPFVSCFLPHSYLSPDEYFQENVRIMWCLSSSPCPL